MVRAVPYPANYQISNFMTNFSIFIEEVFRPRPLFISTLFFSSWLELLHLHVFIFLTLFSHLDINECTESSFICSRPDQCINTIGNYTCCDENQTSVGNTCIECFGPWEKQQVLNKYVPLPFLPSRWSWASRISAPPTLGGP